MYKVIILSSLILFLFSCQTNKLHVYKNNKLYEAQLEKSLNDKKLEDAKFILEHTPNIKTLDYYKYLVRYYAIVEQLDILQKINIKEKNIFVKNYIQALIYGAKGIYYFEDALSSFYKALENKELYNESISELYYNITTVETKKENYKNAIKTIEKALKEEEREKYIVLKAYIIMKQGKYKDAQLLLNNSFEKIHKPKNLLKAMAVMDLTFEKLHPMPEKLKLAYSKWLGVAQTGKHLQLILKVSREGMQEYPEYSEMYTLAGLAAYLLDNKSEAVMFFEKAIAANKELPFNYIQMGVIYWNLKRYIKAKDFFDKAISMNKYLPVVYSYLSKLAENTQGLEEAIKYKKYQISFGSDLDMCMKLVKLYTPARKHEETKELLQKIIKKYPDNKAPYRSMVKLYDEIIEAESNPDVKFQLRKKQIYYEEIFKEKDEEESKKRLVNAEIENNGSTAK